MIISTSFSFREVLSKLGYSTGSGGNNSTLKQQIELYNISTAHFKHKKNKTDWKDEEIFCENSKVSQNKLRKTFKEREFVPYQCNICGLNSIWNDKPLVLRLDHINGSNKDNRLENLQWLCPNCDSQQDTFAGRNRTKKKLEKNKILYTGNFDNEKENIIKIEQKQSETLKQNKEEIKLKIPERQDLKNKLWELKNYTQVANYYNVSPTQIRRWCRKYELPATINIVKHTSEDGWQNENWNDDYKPSVCVEQSIACYMIDENTDKIIKEFSSRSEAAHYLGLSKSAAAHIGAVCKGDRKTAYGYKWKDK